MSSERRSTEGELPDGVADRQQGYTHNPNPPDQVAANRARFEENQRRLQHDREEGAEQVREVQHRVEEQYDASMHDPAHVAFIPEQIAHQEADPPHIRGGHEHTGDPEALATTPTNVEIGQHMPLPTTPRSAEEFNNED